MVVHEVPAVLEMTNVQMVKAFNEWMRRFIEEPDRYNREFESVNQFLADEANGVEPTYGERCTGYMVKLMCESAAAEQVRT